MGALQVVPLDEQIVAAYRQLVAARNRGDNLAVLTCENQLNRLLEQRHQEPAHRA